MQTRQSRSRDISSPVADNRYYFRNIVPMSDDDLQNMLKGDSSKMLMSSKSPSTLKPLNKGKSEVLAKISVNTKTLTFNSTVDKISKLDMDTSTSYNYASAIEKRSADLSEFAASSRLRSQLKDKDREIELLQSKLQEKNRENLSKSQLNRSNTAINMELHNSMNLADIEKEDPQRQRQILHALITQTFECFKLLKSRCAGVQNLLGVLDRGLAEPIAEAELNRMKQTIDELANTLMQSSKTEIELGLKQRENEKKNHDLVRLNTQHSNLRGQYKDLQDQYNDLKKRRQTLEENLRQTEKLLDNEKVKNTKNEKHIEILEKRIELILETDITVDKDKLRKALTELVKENEGLKRDSIVKAKELKKQKDEIVKLQSKVVRQNRKIEALLKSKKGPSSNLLQGKDNDKEGVSQDKIFKDDDLNLLQQNIMPLSLDFRTSSLKINFADLLNDIMDQGPNVFVSQFTNIENMRDKKEAITFVTNQLINFREFSDKLHFFLKESLELLKLEDIRDVQVFLGKYFRHVFNSQTLNLWIPDGITGIFYTVDVTGNEVRCLGTKGLLSDVVKYGKPYNKRHMNNSYVCELTSSNGKYKVDNTLVLPIKKSNGKVIGALEVSNIADSHFGFDEEYFGIALGQLVAHLLHKINFQNTLIQEAKIKDLFIQSFNQLTACTNKYTFSKTVKEYASKVFGVSTANFLYVENNKFVIYTSEKEFKDYDVNIGLSGHVYKSQRGLIISDVSSSKEYNSLVDLVSIMPIYFTPVTITNESTGELEVIGILQLLIKPKGGRAEERIDNVDELLVHLGLEEPIENLANRYCSLIANSIQIFKERARVSTQ